MRKWYEELGVVSPYAFSIESPRVPQLIIHVADQEVRGIAEGYKRNAHHKSPGMSPLRFQHKIKRKLPSKIDQHIIPGLRNNQNVLDVGLNAGTTFVRTRGETYVLSKSVKH